MTRRSINNMVKDQRFEIRADSKTFLLCEICGKNIRTGRVCKNCEGAYHRSFEDDVRQSKITGGYGKAERGDDAEGAKRFRRELF